MASSEKHILVIGHRNPDTDSICSAIAYANLKNQAEHTTKYLACRAGELNRETAFVLNRFQAKAPRRCLNVKAEVRDIDIRQVPGVNADTTMRRSWQTMIETDAHSQPVVDENGVLQGLITMSDLSKGNMDSLNQEALSKAKTPIRNIIETLEGTLLAGSDEGCVEQGKVVIGAGSPEAMEEAIEAGDVVLVANRYDSQLCAIEMDARIVIVCMGSAVGKTIVKLAAEKGVTLISTPYNTFAAAGLIRQSAPIRAYMTPAEKMLSFDPMTPVEEARKVMSKVRYVYFPIIGKNGKYEGLISRRNLLNLQRKRLILVDHNEKTQCIDGYDEAEILEIVDHHRIGNIETGKPVYFRNQPVGCTCTIVYQMYQEQGVEITPDMAGLMLCAILSDTLAFRSPTCTAVDVTTANALAKIAGVDPMQLAEEMFEAGEDLSGRDAKDVFYQDFKVFTHGDLRFGVGQGSYMSEKNIDRAEGLLRPYLELAKERDGLQMVFYMLTSVGKESSRVIFAGDGAGELLKTAFPGFSGQGECELAGVVSRKKQMIPAMLEALQQI